MAWITVSDIEAYLGVTLDSGESAVYDTIIDAVCCWIENHCNTKITSDVYSERAHIIDNYFHLRNHLQWFLSANYGTADVISVTPPSAVSSVRISKDVQTLSLVDGFAVTDIDISTMLLSEVVTAISNEVGWTAVLEDNIEDDYATALYPGSFRTDPNASNEIQLVSAPNHMDLSQFARNLYQTAQACAEGMVTYQGGYDPVPADLLDATIRMTIRAYTLRKGASFPKSEKVGDYSYTNATIADGLGVSGIAIDYYSVLDTYCINLDI